MTDKLEMLRKRERRIGFAESQQTPIGNPAAAWMFLIQGQGKDKFKVKLKTSFLKVKKSASVLIS